MQICKFETEEIQELFRTLTSNFQNFPELTLISGTRKRGFQNFPGGVGTVSSVIWDEYQTSMASVKYLVSESSW